MPSITSLPSPTTKCCECRHASDCPIATDADGRTVNSRVRVARSGDWIHRTGERMDAVYRVRSGSIKTRLIGADGEEQVTGFYGPGEWLGLDALDGSVHRSDAVALDTASVCVLPWPQLREHLAHSPGGLQRIIDAMSERLARKEHMHLTLARDRAEQRLARFLVDLVEHRDAVGLDGDRITLPMSRAEIASYLALAVETVSRILTRMQRASIIEVHRSDLVILDRSALFAAAGSSPDDLPNGRASALNLQSAP